MFRPFEFEAPRPDCYTTNQPRLTILGQNRAVAGGRNGPIDGNQVLNRATIPRVVLWLVAIAALLAPLILLTIALNDDMIPSQDKTVLDWVTSHGFRGLGGISDAISALTDAPPAAGIGIAVVALFWLVGATRMAMGFAVVGAVVLIVIVLGDRTLGGIVEHVAPSGEDMDRSFPAGTFSVPPCSMASGDSWRSTMD